MPPKEPRISTSNLIESDSPDKKFKSGYDSFCNQQQNSSINSVEEQKVSFNE